MNITLLTTKSAVGAESVHRIQAWQSAFRSIRRMTPENREAVRQAALWVSAECGPEGLLARKTLRRIALT